MKSACWFLAISIGLAGPVLAETYGEAFAAFRKAVQTAAADKKLDATTRKALGFLMQRFEGDTRIIPPVVLREWLGKTDATWPPAVQKAARALMAAEEREEVARLAEIEAATLEIIECLDHAADAAALEPVAEKVRLLQQTHLYLPSSETATIAYQGFANAQQLLEGWRAVFAARAAGRPAEALRRLGSLEPQTRALPPDARRKLQARSRDLARAMGVLPPEEADKAVREIVTQVLAAASAKDVDPLIRDLRDKYEVWSNARDLGATDSAEVAARASRFAASWQEYLAANAAGATEQARKALDGLIQGSIDVPGVPRSLLLERSMELSAPKVAPAAAASPAADANHGAGGTETSAPKTMTLTINSGVVEGSRFDQILTSCKKLPDLEGKLGELAAAVSPAPGNPSAGAWRVLEELREINRDYQEARASTQPHVTAETAAKSGLPAIRELRRQLVVFTLARQFADPAAGDDTPAAYLARRLTAAREARDWPAAQRVLEAGKIVGVRSQLCLPSDAAALTYYLGGINFSDAGVLPFATASYLAALQTGSDFVPLDDLRARLAKLRSEHAADYEAGLKVAASGHLPISAREED